MWQDGGSRERPGRWYLGWAQLAESWWAQQILVSHPQLSESHNSVLPIRPEESSWEPTERVISNSGPCVNLLPETPGPSGDLSLEWTGQSYRPFRKEIRTIPVLWTGSTEWTSAWVPWATRLLVWTVQEAPTHYGAVFRSPLWDPAPRLWKEGSSPSLSPDSP